MEIDNTTPSKQQNEHISLLKKSVKEFNQFRMANNFEPIDLSNARFQGTTLTGAKLQNINFTNVEFEYTTLVAADLTNANLTKAKLKNANLSQVILAHANCEEADFSGAQLENANLDGANLSNANLSKANLTHSSLNKTNFDGTNISAANMAEAVLRNTVNLKNCIYDKFTRWPATHSMPPDFNPKEGLMGSNEDFTVKLKHDSHGPAMTPQQLKDKLIDKIDVKDANLGDIQKQQLLLDRKLDYIIAGLRSINDRVNKLQDGGGVDSGTGEGSDSYQGPSRGGVDSKLHDLEEKIDNIAGILTRFPVKSLEETYKLTDVIKQIDKSQQDVYAKISDFVLEVKRANEEIQHILTGNFRIQSIVGLDQAFEKTCGLITAKVKESEERIIDEQARIEVRFDESVISQEIEKHMGLTAQALREQVEKKFDAQGLFIKQIKEEIEAIKTETDIPSLFRKMGDEIDYKTTQLEQLSERASRSQEEHLENLSSKIRLVDQKIDILSETNTLNAISGIIAEFGAGFSTELQKVKAAAIAIENRLRKFTGDVDLSKDSGIDVMVRAIEENLSKILEKGLADDPFGGKVMNDITYIKSLCESIKDKGTSIDPDDIDKLKDSLGDKITASFDESLVTELRMLKDAVFALSSKGSDISDEAISRLEAALNDRVQDAMQEVTIGVEDIIRLETCLTEAMRDSINKQTLTIENLREVEKNIKARIDQLESSLSNRSGFIQEIVGELAKSAGNIPAVSKAFDIEDDVKQLKDLAKSVDEKFKAVEAFDTSPEAASDAMGKLKEEIDFIVDRSKFLADESEAQEIANKAMNLKEMSSIIADRIVNMHKDMAESNEFLMPVKLAEDDDTQELLEEFAIELKELKETLQTSNTLTKENLSRQSKVNVDAINRLREDVTASIDSLVNGMAGMDQGEFPLARLFEQIKLEEDLIDKQGLMKNISESITSKVNNLLEAVNNKADVLEHKVDILAQTEKDTTDYVSDMLAGFREELLAEIKGDKTLSEAILAGQAKTEAALSGVAGVVGAVGAVGAVDATSGEVILDKMDKLADEVRTDIIARIDILEDVLLNKSGSLKDIVGEIVKTSGSLPAAAKAFNIQDEVKMLKELTQSVNDQMKKVETIETAPYCVIGQLQNDIKSIIDNSQALAVEANMEEFASKAINLKDMSSAIADRLENLYKEMAESKDFSLPAKLSEDDTTQELLEEFAIELKELRETLQAAEVLDKDNLTKQAKVNAEAINSLREDLTSSIDALVNSLAGIGSQGLPVGGMLDKVKIEGDIADKQELMKSLGDQISTKVQSLLETMSNKAEILEQKVDILAQTEKDTTDYLSDMLSAFREELLSDIKGDMTSKLDTLQTMIAEVAKSTVALPAAAKAYNIEDEVKQLKELTQSVNEKIKEVGSMESFDTYDIVKQLKAEVDFIAERSKELADETDIEEVATKVLNLKDMSSEISDRIESLYKGMADSKDISFPAKLSEDDNTQELLEEFAIELKELRETVQTSKTMDKESLARQAKLNEASINKLREDVTGSIDSLVQRLSGLESEGLPVSHLLEKIKLEEEISDKQTLMKALGDQITDKVQNLLSTVNDKADILEQKVDILAQSEKDTTDYVSDMLSNFRDELMAEIKGEKIVKEGEDAPIAPQEILISKVTEIAENVVELKTRLDSLGEKVTANSLEEIVDLINELEASLSTKIETVRDVSEEVNNTLIAMEDLTLSKVLESTQEVISITRVIEDRLIEVAQSTGSEEVQKIAEWVDMIKDINIELSSKLEEVDEKIDMNDVSDVISNVEDSIMREVQYLKDLTASINEEIVDFESNIDTDNLEQNLQELLIFNREVITKLDKVLAITGNMDLDTILIEIKENIEEQLSEKLTIDIKIEEIFKNLGSDLSTKLVHIAEHSKHVNARLNQLIEFNRAGHLPTILREIDKLKTYSNEISDKLELIGEETKNLNLEDLINEFQNEIVSKLDVLTNEFSTSSITGVLNESLVEFHNKIVEKTEAIEAKLDSITEDSVAEGIDYLTTDINALKRTTSDIIDKLQVVIHNTDTLQTSEGIEKFRESVEIKLSELIENASTLNMEGILAGMTSTLSDKIEEYYGDLSKILSQVEERLMSTLTGPEISSISTFIEKSDDQIKTIQTSIKDVHTKVELIQLMTENTLLTKEDIEDLFSSIDAITGSLNLKVEEMVDRVEKKFEENEPADLDKIKHEITATLKTLNNTTKMIKEKFDIDFEGEITTKVRAVELVILDKLEYAFSELLKGSERIESRIDEYSSDEIVRQIDTLISETLTGFNKEVGQISEITELVSIINEKMDTTTGKLDQTAEKVDKSARRIDKSTEKIEVSSEKLVTDLEKIERILSDLSSKRSDGSALISKDTGLDLIMSIIQKNADQNLSLMRELINAGGSRGSGDLDGRLRRIEEKLGTAQDPQAERMKKLLESLKSVLEDMQGGGRY